MRGFHKPVPATVWALAALLLAGAVVLPFVASPFHLRLAQQILLFGGLAVAWNLLGGFTTYWSFGHAAFFGLGAFAAGLLGQQLGAEFSVAARLIIGLAFAVAISLVAAVAVALPVLRLRGIYFAIAMLAFAQILGEVSKTFDLFQGAMGFPLPLLKFPGLEKVQLFYFLFLLFCLVSVAVFVLVKRSRLGVGLTCIGQDEDTAAMLGVPTERYKLVAFVLSAMLTAAGGVLYVYGLGFMTSETVFRIDISLNLILFSMVGGIGTVAGPLIGATIMILLTQVVLGDLLDLHMMLTGAVLIAMVILAPKGLLGLFRRAWSRRRLAETVEATP
ncbi:branched-chain amino acid ABC transporter permease [Rhodospirillaceae bacterium SYSU D60014]|uniref:branched-chain amino acid ABC transporter permease n=1 Tax=Virgifigura deserti TaxID=2268457 RepID=UPI000E66C1E6